MREKLVLVAALLWCLLSSWHLSSVSATSFNHTSAFARRLRGVAKGKSDGQVPRSQQDRFVVPFWTSAIDFTNYWEADTMFDGHVECKPFDSSLVDVYKTTDRKCWTQDDKLCFVGWTRKGEWLQYAFEVKEKHVYDVTVSLGSVKRNRRVEVKIPGVGEREYYAPGHGWETFWTYTWTTELSPGDYDLDILFLDGEVNVCSVSVEHGNAYKPPPQGMPFRAGDFSAGKRSDDGQLYLSNGLTCNVIAEAGKYVKYADGTYSSRKFHDKPDAAGVIPKKGSDHYYYIDNAEKDEPGSLWWQGGVGVLEFNGDGKVVSYKKIANRMRRPCGGGVTPWNSWVLGEEIEGGEIWQVDPNGRYEKTAMGSKGFYETIAFYFDDSNNRFHAYATRDTEESVLTRYIANDKGMKCYRKQKDEDRWCTLSNGDIDYLVISGGSKGTFSWTKDFDLARKKTWEYPNAEGIVIANGLLRFVSKVKKRLFVLDLEKGEYFYESTRRDNFNDQPDQIVFNRNNADIMIMCEEGGYNAGLFGRKETNGKYFSFLKGVATWDGEETSGVSWSPDSKHLYFAYLERGILYDCTRDDGLTFDDPYDIVYL